MSKRFISSNASEILGKTSAELKQSIKASAGRIILSENVAPVSPYIGDITNAEMAKAFGADLILLNGVDVLNPEIAGIGEYEGSFVKRLHELVGRPIGVNLEPVDMGASMVESRLEIPSGRQVNDQTLLAIEELGMDFVCLTGNPGTGVTNDAIIESVKIVKEQYSGLIIAGKMHSAGVDEPVADADVIKRLVAAGADIILAPSVGSVPGFDQEDLKEAVKIAHAEDALIMSAIGTSQEGADPETIRYMAIQNKICGVDIQHIGDAGYAGLAPVENIFEMSKAIRGHRHTISMISRSVNR